ncbi:MAG: osmoprotectant transport system ATP-binding protein [Thermoleophilaceae bacterium]|nr:osmoprotectant transport system ATP-binding protein [Thermoleophilaceae bacterium]
MDELSLTIGTGEICMLVGPSGGGKTTALKMINRLIDFEGGDITIDGQSVRSLDVTELRRGIGYVIQQIGLFPHMNVEANIGTVPRLIGWDKKRIKARSRELIELVGLDPDRDARRYPAQLSGGQRQRIGLARALAADPPVMLMDEPFGALDPITRDRLQQEFLSLQARIRKTVVFVTHDIDEAIKMADRIAILREGGRLAQYDTPDKILAEPVDEFVEQFVGADRGLKRLALRRVGEIAPIEAPAARPGDNAQAARARVQRAGFESLVVVDEAGRPTGLLPVDRLAAERVPSDGALPLETVGTPEMPLRDALSVMLSQTGSHLVVVDDQGRLAGLVSADLISQALAAGAATAAPPLEARAAL